MAIRRGPMAVPENASDVFNTSNQVAAAPAVTSGFVTDALLRLRTLGGHAYPQIYSRLTGIEQLITQTNGVSTTVPNMKWDYMNGAGNEYLGGTTTTVPTHMWRRAPGYFDVVSYTGTGSNRTVAHNLGVAPEMMWVKSRNATRSWSVFHSALGPTKGGLGLDLSSPASTDSTVWNDTSPTSAVFTVGTYGNVNTLNNTYIAYLFATAPGVSKVGSYTGNGGTQNIDCGFSSGARFVLIKRSSNAQDWYIFDSTRGIVAGNDPYLKLNTTDAEATAADEIDPLSSGFTIHQTGSAGINFSGHTYIFYAIA